MKIKQEGASGRFAGLRRLALNKWSLTIAVMLVMLSVYVTMEEPSEVLYVSDTLPYEIQKVSGDGDLQVLPKEENEQAKEQDKAASGDNAPDGDADDVGGKDIGEKNTDGQGENVQENAAAVDADEGIDKAIGGAEGFSINSDSDYFINYRMEREKARSKQLELLQGVIDGEDTENAVRAEAEAQVLAQAKAIEQELMLESILVAKYGGDAAVFMQEGLCNVVLSVNSDKISDNEAEKIALLVDNYTKIGYENVVVVIKN